MDGCQIADLINLLGARAYPLCSFKDMPEFVMERRDLLYSERVLLRKSIAGD